MKAYKSGEKVSKGIYFSLKGFKFYRVKADQQVLEGPQNASYFLLPPQLLMLLAPLCGGLFVLLFPFVVVAMVILAPLLYFVRTPIVGLKDLILRVSPKTR